MAWNRTRDFSQLPPRVMLSKRAGKCADCGAEIVERDVIAWDGRAHCAPCCGALGRLYDPDGLLPPVAAPVAKAEPSADEIRAAALDVLNGAPEFLRPMLDDVRRAARELAYLRCPREAFHAAVLMGRHEGDMMAAAKAVSDPLVALGAALDAPAAPASVPPPPPPASGGFALDDFAGILDLPALPEEPEEHDADDSAFDRPTADSMPADVMPAAAPVAKRRPASVDCDGPAPWDVAA